MLVNCENSSTRRPSSSSSGNSVISSSSLAEPLTVRALSNDTRRGSQQTWRSFSSASRMMMPLCAMPLRATSARTFSCSARRRVSYRSRWSPASGTSRRISVFGGSSVATASLVRRSRKGAMRRRSCSLRASSPWRSMGVRNRRRKRRSSPSMSGIRKSSRDHSSPRWFSNGVPVRHSRCREVSARVAWAALLRGFLIAWASSRMSRCQSCAASTSRSRGSSG